VLDTFLAQLAREPDSLIVRRHGIDVATTVSRRAAMVLATPAPDREAAIASFDHDLRVPRRVNPGTTADLIAASIYTALRSTA
jgi:triphosphoribosyl-dephospho-CoA synthase